MTFIVRQSDVVLVQLSRTNFLFAIIFGLMCVDMFNSDFHFSSKLLELLTKGLSAIVTFLFFLDCFISKHTPKWNSIVYFSGLLSTQRYKYVETNKQTEQNYVIRLPDSVKVVSVQFKSNQWFTTCIFICMFLFQETHRGIVFTIFLKITVSDRN